MSLKKPTLIQKVMSIIIGLITGAWIGWVINITLSNYNLTFPFSLYILSIFLSFLVGLMAYFVPRTTEILIAGFTVSIIVIGALWDLIISDWSMLRGAILLSGLGIIVIDIFLGTITIFDFWKIAKRLGGAKT